MITSRRLRTLFPFLLGALLLFSSCGASRTPDRVPKSRGALSIVQDYLRSEHIAITDSNRITLLPSGREKFDDLFAHLRQAKHHIHLEYFNFRNDSISSLLFDVLAERAAAGVKVRALFDAFGNMSNDQPLKRRHLDSLRRLGIEIYKFDPIRFPWFNHVASRDHRKIVVIDGSVGYLGGMNIADYYIEGKQKIGQWRDMHCRVEGEAVRDLQVIFAEMWEKTTGEQLADSVYFTPSLPAETTSLAIVDRKPYARPHQLREAYALAISQADSSVHIINPYFVPTRKISRAIRQALARGVNVEIMVSSVSDIPFTPEAMLHKLRKLAKRGARVHLYKEGFHHSKVMTIDGRFGTLGSLNLNSRSLRYDYETNVFFFDPQTTARLDSIYAQDVRASIPLDDHYWRKRSVFRKIVGWFANLFTPFI